MYKILIIEDNVSIKKELMSYLQNYYHVECVNDFSQTFEQIESFKPDLLLIDLNLPIYDGHFIVDQIRKTSTVPIIVVTSKDNTSDELLAVKLGADDYIHKPYHLQILQTRIDNLLKRAYLNASFLSVGKYVLDYTKNEIKVEDEIISLTNTETKILYCLFKSKNNLVTKSDLMKFLWDSDLFIDENALAVNISRIRKKIKENIIQNIRNMGYVIYETTP